jgi:hypothetical protein
MSRAIEETQAGADRTRAMIGWRRQGVEAERKEAILEWIASARSVPELDFSLLSAT